MRKDQRGSLCCACAKWVCTSTCTRSGCLLYIYNNKEWLEVPEINALRRNHDDIVGAMSHDLDYFKRVFVQAGFIRSSNASGIMGLLGVSASEKAGQLLESLLTQISESTPQGTRQQKFHKFVEMLMREASTEDVVVPSCKNHRIYYCFPYGPCLFSAYSVYSA